MEKSHLGWSIFNFVFSLPTILGVAISAPALIYSGKCRDARNCGDYEAADSYARTAKFLNIASTIYNVLNWVAYIIIIIVVPVALSVQATTAAATG